MTVTDLTGDFGLHYDVMIEIDGGEMDDMKSSEDSYSLHITGWSSPDFEYDWIF